MQPFRPIRPSDHTDAGQARDRDQKATVHVLVIDRLAHYVCRVSAFPTTTVDGGAQNRRSELVAHSHSMVPGGLLVTSSTTRLTSGTSLVIRVEILARTSYGTRVQSAVIASSEETGRSTTGCP